MKERGQKETLYAPALARSELYEALQTTVAWKRELFFFSSLSKVFRKSGGGAMLFLFCYNGPLCGDGRGEEVCVPVVRTLPRDSQGNFPGLLKSAGPPRCREKGRGTGPGWS